MIWGLLCLPDLQQALELQVLTQRPRFYSLFASENDHIVQAQLTEEEKYKRQIEGLEDHRHLIEAAVRAMGEGDLRQALTIATSLRVLIHETGASKPLLKRFKSNYLDLPIMDDPTPQIHRELPGRLHSHTFTLPISLKFSIPEGNISLNVDIDSPNQSVPIPLGAWWTKPFMNLPAVGSYSRQQLILDMANKEAAHVDVRISEQYKLLLGSQFLRLGTDDKAAVVNISRLLVGKAGIQLLRFLQRHFPKS